MVTDDDNSQITRRQMMTLLMQETITTLCRNMLKFKVELCVEGLLGITLDKTDVILLNIKETIEVSNTQPNGMDESICDDMSLGEARCEDLNHSPSVTQASSCRRQCKEGILSSDAVLAVSGNETGHTHNSASNKKVCLKEDKVYHKPSGSKSYDKETTGNSDLEGESQNLTHLKTGKDFESENCSNILTRPQKLKKKLNHVNHECQTSLWNDQDIKQEHLDDSVHTDCEILPYHHHIGDKFDLKHLDRNTTLFQRQIPSDQQGWLMFNHSGFNETDLMNSSNSVYSPSFISNAGTGYQCTICLMQFTTRHHLKRHVNAIHSQTPMLSHCPICHKAFRRRDTMRRHCKSVHYRVMSLDAIDVLEIAGVEGSIGAESENDISSANVKTGRWNVKSDERPNLEFSDE